LLSEYLHGAAASTSWMLWSATEIDAARDCGTEFGATE